MLITKSSETELAVNAKKYKNLLKKKFRHYGGHSKKVANI